MYEMAKVSAQITFHTNTLLFFQGITVTPSGCFPSKWNKPGGSRRAGVSIAVRLPFTRSLRQRDVLDGQGFHGNPSHDSLIKDPHTAGSCVGYTK